MPAGFSENDNGQMAAVYNELDRIADRLRCCFVLIHHTSKGDQGGKSVTDVGAGAGAQSRATDSHLVLRPHKEDGAVVLEATARSWPPVSATCLRWSHPVWHLAPDLDPRDVRGRGKCNPASASGDAWDVERFVAKFVTETPRMRLAIVEAAFGAGLSKRRANDLLSQAVEESLVTKLDFGRNRRQRFLRQADQGASREVA